MNDAILFNDCDGLTFYFLQVCDSQFSQIIERMPGCVVAVCKHLRLESVCEYCALNSFASSLILLHLCYVVCICVLNIIFVFIWYTFNIQRNYL